MKVKVVLNPYANRWGAQASVPAVRAAFARAGLDCDLVLTTRRWEGAERARAAALDGYDAIVAAGGDGTVSEVVNGLVAAAGEGPTSPLGVLPLGTGNDFNDMLGLPRTLDESVAVIAAGNMRQIDAGQVNGHTFDNNCALAMEPMVTIENEKMKRISGNIRYVAALLKSLLKLKAWHMRIAWEGGQHEGPTYLLSVCNSPRTGGIFYMAPEAKVDDGLLDFVFAPEMPRRKVLALLPGLFNGTHLNHPLVSHGRTPWLTVESEPGTPIHADGEVIAESVRHVRYEVLPGKITLLAP
ncbi:MAG: diacylglycerol kinase family lipid kinase [Candidatus Promineifilaceae bacterium]|nr:diacylglycerol kinase family lipid kinase [Candidatus Promineifilaceae bacterium]